jgi:hypothetical protein
MGHNFFRKLTGRLMYPVVRPSTVARANEGANALVGTVVALFGTADSGSTGNKKGKEHFAPPDAPAAVDGLRPYLDLFRDLLCTCRGHP